MKAMRKTAKSYAGEVPLLPCPFCGQPARIESGRDPAKVGCFNPECGVRPKASSTCENTAVTKWNGRKR